MSDPKPDQDELRFFLDDCDPMLLSALLSVINEHELGKALEEDQKLWLCKEAIEENRTSDSAWLEERLLACSETKEPHRGFWEIPVQETEVLETQEDLEAVLAHHQKWLESVLQPEKEIQGGRAQLADQDLSAFQLSGLNLRGAQLSGTKFHQMELFAVDFSTACLKGAEFSHCDLTGSLFKRADLSGAKFIHCQLANTDFRRAKTPRCQFDHSDLSSCRHPPSLLSEEPKPAPPPPEAFSPSEDLSPPPAALETPS